MDAMQTDAGDFLLWSECVARLMEGMYGSFKQPEQVREARDLVLSQILDPKLTLADSRKLARNLRLASMNFGPRKQEAGKALRMAALKGAFPVYIKLPAKREASRSPAEPVLVSPGVLARVIPTRGTLPNRPTALEHTGTLSRREAGLRSLLLRGELIVKRADFDDWYKKERARGLWQPQSNSEKRRRGRPRKSNVRLRNAIVALANGNRWKAADGMPLLSRLLAAEGHDPPSCDTLARIVDELYRERGDTRLRRPSRQPPTASRKNRRTNEPRRHS